MDYSTYEVYDFDDVCAFNMSTGYKERSYKSHCHFHRQRNYPSATSSAIIRLNPTANATTPIFECSPADISGINSSTTHTSLLLPQTKEDTA